MKTFIEISRAVRAEYKEKLPFIAAMCKLPQREDVILYLNKYLNAKPNKKWKIKI